LSIKFIILTPYISDGTILQYEWKLNVVFDFSGRGGAIDLYIVTSRLLLGTSIIFTQVLRFWVNIIIIMVAITSLILSFRAIAQSFQYYQLKFTENTNLVISWNKLPLAEKLKFFNFWFIVSIFGNICNIIASILSMIEISAIDLGDSSVEIFSGLGCMLSWVNLVRYFEYNKKYYILIMSLKRAAPNVFRFFIGALPVLVGYTMFGVANFSIIDRFRNVDQTLVTLFATLNGDELIVTFASIYPVNPIISRIYLYTFICIFIYAVLNIFIFIVEEAFQYAKEVAEEMKDNSDNKEEKPINDSRMIDPDTDINLTDPSLWNNMYKRMSIVGGFPKNIQMETHDIELKRTHTLLGRSKHKTREIIDDIEPEGNDMSTLLDTQRELMQQLTSLRQEQKQLLEKVTSLSKTQ